MRYQPAILIVMVFVILQGANAELNDSVCNETYPYTLKYGVSYPNNTISYIEGKTGLTWASLKYYVENWQALCSNMINRTLKPEFVCNKIYFFLIEKDYNYSSNNLEALKIEINKNISLSLNLLNYYIDNYFDLCYAEGYSEKPPNKKYPVMKVTRGLNETSCDYTINGFFDLYIPFGRMSLGDIECGSKLKWFIRLEEMEGSTYYIGLKLWYLIMLLAIGIIILIIKSIKSTNYINRALKDEMQVRS